MNENIANNGTDRSAGQRPRTLAGLLASSLDMEDEICNGVYKDYMEPNNWPTGMDQNVFKEIQKHLTTLIEDTRRHRKIICGLINQYGKDKPAGQR
jgi:Mg2+ and Co2+ transporter CorA